MMAQMVLTHVNKNIFLQEDNIGWENEDFFKKRSGSNGRKLFSKLFGRA